MEDRERTGRRKKDVREGVVDRHRRRGL